MNEIPPFNFERTRGIIWVCDIHNSSSYLNDLNLVDDIENYLPRIYFVSKIFIETYGGIFLKWTGDGFLAFFRVELDRDIPEMTLKIFDAAFHLSTMNSLTQFGIKSKKKFWIKHGITYEKDALLMKIKDDQNVEKLDIIGRSVVLAFRLSGINSEFPSIATVNELAQYDKTKFIPWKINLKDKLKYLKGEKFNLSQIRISGKNVKEIPNWDLEWKRFVKEIQKRAKEIAKYNNINLVFEKMDNGPEWCKEVSKIEKELLETHIVKPLNKLRDIMRKD